MIVERENRSTVLASAKMISTIPGHAEKRSTNGESTHAGTACAGSDSALAKQQQNASTSRGHVEHGQLQNPVAALPKAHIPSPSTTQAVTTTQQQQQQQQPSSAAAAHAYSAAGFTNNNLVYDQPQAHAHHHAAAQSVVVVGGGGSSSAAAGALGGVQHVQAPPYQTPHGLEHQNQPRHSSPNPYFGQPTSLSALPPLVLAPGADANGSGGLCPRASSSSGGSSVARSTPGLEVPTPSTSFTCSSGVPHYTTRHIIALGLGQEDRNHLTEYLCFIRNEIMEVFPATASDVHSDGNARGVVQDQIGMRCRFCAHRNRMERANRSTSYPSSVSRMCQSLTMMIREHLPACPDMPPDVRERYNTLKAGNTGSRTKESKRYWIASAHSLGLVDTESGMRMRPTTAPSVPASRP